MMYIETGGKGRGEKKDKKKDIKNYAKATKEEQMNDQAEKRTPSQEGNGKALFRRVIIF